MHMACPRVTWLKPGGSVDRQLEEGLPAARRGREELLNF